MCCCGRILLSSNKKKYYFQRGAHKRGLSPSHPKELPPPGHGVWGAAGVLLCPRFLLNSSASGWRSGPRSFPLTVSPQLPGGFSCAVDVAPGRCPLRTTGILSVILPPRHRGSWGPSSSSLLLPAKENNCWSQCSLTPNSLAQWKGPRRSMKLLSLTPLARPPKPQFVLVLRNCT